MTTTPSLSQRLRDETAAQHQRMHELMAQGDPFSSRERYARFVAAQCLFQRDVEHLFADAQVQAAVPDLAVRGRASASLTDLADLDAMDKVASPADVVTRGVKMPEALGWLYVSEGSTLGAAFLFKEAGEKLGLSASFGARNLAAYPEGRARVWKRFVEALDEPALVSAQDAVIAGALAAYGASGCCSKRSSHCTRTRLREHGSRSAAAGRVAVFAWQFACADAADVAVGCSRGAGGPACCGTAELASALGRSGAGARQR